MEDEIKTFLLDLKKNSEASNDLIQEAENIFKVKFPQEYVDFLKFTNGGEGFLSQNSYIRFWPVEELLSENRGYKILEYLPKYLAFGTNGASESFGFDTREDNWKVVQIDLIDLSWENALPVGNSFNSFLRNLHAGKSAL